MTDNRSGGADFKGEKIEVGQDVVGRDKNIYYASPPATFHHNSLPNQPYFFGRKGELEKIANALDPEVQGWGVLISGPGGIGKTALAIRAGHLVSDEDYPIKIFLSAKVTQLTPQGVEDLQDFMLPNYTTLLAELARELGDENIAKIDPAQRANEVRRLLADRRALIIIDNLETFDEKTERSRVFQFLSRLPRSCKAIVTSRRRIDTPAEIIRLDRLMQEDALELIAKLATRNKHLAKATEQERLSLYETTRGNPLLIEWIAGQLGNPKSKCRTLADAIRFLENAPKDNDPLEFVFGDLLESFSEHEVAVLAALTYFTQPAPVAWIAQIAKITEAQAETALEDLADRSILTTGEMLISFAGDSQPLQGYFLPSLTATFLRHAQPEIVAKASDNLSYFAYGLARENDHRNRNCLQVLEFHWPILAAALPLVLTGESNRLQRFCSALQWYLDLSGRWDERLLLCLHSETMALTNSDWERAGWRAYQSGRVYYLRGQPTEVFECAKRADNYWKKVNTGAREEAYAVWLRSLGYRLTGDYSAAIADCRKAVNLWRVFSAESSDVAIGLNSLAELERLSGDYDSAERDYNEALNIDKKIHNLEGMASHTGNLANLLLDRGNWPAAEQLAREALLLSERVGRQELIANNCRHIAHACVRQGRTAEGLPYAQRAVAIFTKLRSPGLAAAQAVLKECEEASE